MKILIVSKCPTHPTNAGNRWWILSQSRYFQKLGHEVHFLYINEIALRTRVAESKQSLKVTKMYWGANFHQYNVPILQKMIWLLRSKFQNIFKDSYYTIDQYYPWKIHNYVNKLNYQYNFDACIINYAYLSKLFTKISIPLKGIATHDALAYRNLIVGYQIETISASQEAKALQRCPHIFALQNVEANYFQLLSPRSKVYRVYGQFSYKSSPIVGNKKILFLSGNNIFNQNGILWFLREIFPSIIKSIDGVELIIGGSICKTLESQILPQNVKLVGYVDDPIDFYSLGDVAINPVFEGTGLKIKTFEAVAFDKVTIVHPHSMNGIFNNGNVPIYPALSAAEWVEYLDKVWSDISEIKLIKSSNHKYINEMNLYINKQYNTFFQSINQ